MFLVFVRSEDLWRCFDGCFDVLWEELFLLWGCGAERNLSQYKIYVKADSYRAKVKEKSKISLMFDGCSLNFFACCLPNWKFERLGDQLDEIVTIIAARRNDVVYHDVHLIREARCQDVGCFILWYNFRFRSCFPLVWMGSYGVWSVLLSGITPDLARQMFSRSQGP